MAKRFDLDFLSFVAPQRDAGAAREHQDRTVPPILQHTDFRAERNAQCRQPASESVSAAHPAHNRVPAAGQHIQ